LPYPHKKKEKKKEAPLVAHPLAGWNFYSWNCPSLFWTSANTPHINGIKCDAIWEHFENLLGTWERDGNTLRRK
jgi:hypothetical protein